MSSLTSPSVNKNNRTFAPKVKSRPRKAAQQQQQEKQQQQEQAAAAAEKQAESSKPHTQPAQQNSQLLQVPAQRHDSASHEGMSALETLAAVASSASREIEAPEVAAAPRASTPQPQAPPSATESSSSTKDSATIKPKTTERSKDKGKQRKPQTSKKSSSKNSSNSSTGKAIPISTPISIPTPGQSSSENTRDSPAASQGEGETDSAAEARRTRGRKRNRDYDPEELQTLDDIQHDPASKDYLDRPMVDFIKDLQTGIVSKAFKEYEIDRLKKKKQLEEQSKMSTEDREAAQAQEQMEGRIRELQEEARRKEREELLKKKEEEENNVLQETSNAPQVRLVNGQIVLDVDSLTMERQNEYEEMDTSAMEVVEESTMSRKVNSRTHGKHVQTARWTVIETEMFYDAIAMFGTDFEMVKHVLPNRTRNQIRTKFNREEKQNPEKIKDYLIRKRKPVDLDKVKELTGKEFEEVPDEFSEPISTVDEE